MFFSKELTLVAGCWCVIELEPLLLPLPRRRRRYTAGSCAAAEAVTTLYSRTGLKHLLASENTLVATGHSICNDEHFTVEHL